MGHRLTEHVDCGDIEVVVIPRALLPVVLHAPLLVVARASGVVARALLVVVARAPLFVGVVVIVARPPSPVVALALLVVALAVLVVVARASLFVVVMRPPLLIFARAPLSTTLGAR